MAADAVSYLKQTCGELSWMNAQLAAQIDTLMGQITQLQNDLDTCRADSEKRTVELALLRQEQNAQARRDMSHEMKAP